MKIITFYSYKGGVGRTMCLANIAVLLAKWGHKVLVVDWDLEAPGLERYFAPENFNGTTKTESYGIDFQLIKEKPGLINLLNDRNLEAWKETLIPVNIPEATLPINFISAGRRDERYFQQVRDFNVESFYKKQDGGEFIENLRIAWSESYDFVLIDSRTGITEINGICTIQMPDLVVLLFTATNQGFEGVMDIADRASKAQQKLPYDRHRLLFLPVLTRVESAEKEKTHFWIEHFSIQLKGIYEPWLPSHIKREDFMLVTKIPHEAYYVFGEELAVIKDGTLNPAGMGYAFENIASLIANRLQKVEEFFEKRETFIKQSGRNGKTLKVYINYNVHDRELAEKIKNYLRSNEIEAIIDFDDMAAGVEIASFIERAQRESDFYFFIVSQHSLQSGWVFYDLLTFLNSDKSKNFIPVQTDNTWIDNGFIFTAIENVDKKLKDLIQFKKKSKDMSIGFEHLEVEIERLTVLRENLPKIIKLLRGLLVLDVSDNNFESSMARALKIMKS